MIPTSLEIFNETVGVPLVATPANFDFATAAVVSFVLMLLGMAAVLLLMLKFTGKNLQEKD